MQRWSKSMATVKPRKAAQKGAKSARKAGRKTTAPRKAAAARPSRAAARRAGSRKAPAAKARRAAAKPRASAPAIVSFKERPGPGRPALAEARPLRIVLFGASGNIGQRIASEAIRRGHEVTAVMRHPERLTLRHPKVRPVKADATDPLMVATIAKGHDAIVSAIAPTKEDPEVLAEAATSVLQGAREAGIKRVMVVNGAGSLRVGTGKSGRMLMDTPRFPQEWRWVAQAHKDALGVLRERGEGLDWTAVSPAAVIEPGKRTGRFRVGGDQLLADPKGESRISIEDYAAAFMDELETERNVGRRMTVAY